MSYFNLYVKKPVVDSSLVEEVSLMIDVVKPSRKTFVIGLARHIVTSKTKSIGLDTLVGFVQSSIKDDEYLNIDDDILIKWIKDDKYLNIRQAIIKNNQTVELVELAEDITKDNIAYVTTMELWLNFTNKK